MTDATPLSVSIVEAVADRAEVSPSSLPPLFDVVDPDALEALFDCQGDGARSGAVEFTYAGYSVVVRYDESRTIVVNELDEPSVPEAEHDGSTAGSG